MVEEWYRAEAVLSLLWLRDRQAGSSGNHLLGDADSLPLELLGTSPATGFPYLPISSCQLQIPSLATNIAIPSDTLIP